MKLHKLSFTLLSFTRLRLTLEINVENNFIKNTLRQISLCSRPIQKAQLICSILNALCNTMIWFNKESSNQANTATQIKKSFIAKSNYFKCCLYYQTLILVYCKKIKNVKSE